VLITEVLWEKLHGWQLGARRYGEAYREVADHLAAADWAGLPLAGPIKEYFGRMAHAMRVWVSATQTLGL
jgi:hypothetical protein